MQTWHCGRHRTAASRLSALLIAAILAAAAPRLSAQAALLLEQPYGVFGTLNPTGHAAIYLEHVCAETPVRLRLCRPDELGSVVSRYKGIKGYDWVAIPLIPYLYSVDEPDRAPSHVDQATVKRLRDYYRDAWLGDWGRGLPKGNFFYDGWVELVGTAYDRRTYAFRFATTRRQDERVIAKFNALPNRSHFNILYNNCADFDRLILNVYFPGKFNRTIFPDAGITTPKRLAYGLVQYAKKHPEMRLTVLEIPQVPGYRRVSHADRGVIESIVTNGYVIPVVILNPYVAAGLLADYLVRGRYRLIPKDPAIVDPRHLQALTGDATGLTQVAAGARSHEVRLPVSGESALPPHWTHTLTEPQAPPQSLPLE